MLEVYKKRPNQNNWMKGGDFLIAPARWAGKAIVDLGAPYQAETGLGKLAEGIGRLAKAVLAVIMFVPCALVSLLGVLPKRHGIKKIPPPSEPPPLPAPSVEPLPFRSSSHYSSFKKLPPLDQILSQGVQRNHEVVKVKADGNCFYRAVAVQVNAEALVDADEEAAHKRIRREVADYLRAHRNDQDVSAYMTSAIADHQEASANSRRERLESFEVELQEEQKRHERELSELQENAEALGSEFPERTAAEASQHEANVKEIQEKQARDLDELQRQEIDSADDFLNRVGEDRFFASMPECLAVSCLYKREVHVFYDREPAPRVVFQPDVRRNSPLCLNYVNGDHFDLLWPIR